MVNVVIVLRGSGAELRFETSNEYAAKLLASPPRTDGADWLRLDSAVGTGTVLAVRASEIAAIAATGDATEK